MAIPRRTSPGSSSTPSQYSFVYRPSCPYHSSAPPLAAVLYIYGLAVIRRLDWAFWDCLYLRPHTCHGCWWRLVSCCMGMCQKMRYAVLLSDMVRFELLPFPRLSEKDLKADLGCLYSVVFLQWRLSFPSRWSPTLRSSNVVATNLRGQAGRKYRCESYQQRNRSRCSARCAVMLLMDCGPQHQGVDLVGVIKS